MAIIYLYFVVLNFINGLKLGEKWGRFIKIVGRFLILLDFRVGIL